MASMMQSSPHCQTLGQQLRSLREAMGLSQHELARRMEVQQGQCSKWECDSEPVPGPRIDQLAAILGVDPARLHAFNLQSKPGRRSIPALVKRCHERSPGTATL